MRIIIYCTSYRLHSKIEREVNSSSIKAAQEWVALRIKEDINDSSIISSEFKLVTTN